VGNRSASPSDGNAKDDHGQSQEERGRPTQAGKPTFQKIEPRSCKAAEKHNAAKTNRHYVRISNADVL